MPDKWTITSTSLPIKKTQKIVLENESVWGPWAVRSKHLIIGEIEAEFNPRAGQSRGAAQSQVPRIIALWAQMYLQPHSSDPNVSTSVFTFFYLGQSKWQTPRIFRYFQIQLLLVQELILRWLVLLIHFQPPFLHWFAYWRLLFLGFLWLDNSSEFFSPYLYENKLEGDFWVGFVLVFGFVIFCGRLLYVTIHAASATISYQVPEIRPDKAKMVFSTIRVNSTPS